MQLYDMGEFIYPYKKVNGNYKYLASSNDPEDHMMLFDLILTFLNSC